MADEKEKYLGVEAAEGACQGKGKSRGWKWGVSFEMGKMKGVREGGNPGGRAKVWKKLEKKQCQRGLQAQ